MDSLTSENNSGNGGSDSVSVSVSSGNGDVVVETVDTTTATTTATTTTTNTSATTSRKPGEAPIKSEFLKANRKRTNEEMEADEKAQSTTSTVPQTTGKPKKVKKQKSEYIPESDRLCQVFLKEKSCPYGDSCKYSHDLQKYLSTKQPSLGKCYLYETYGECKYGIKCLFGGDHIDGINSIVNKEVSDKCDQSQHQLQNDVSNDIRVMLTKKKYPFKKTEEYFIKNNLELRRNQKGNKNNNNNNKKETKSEESKEDSNVNAAKVDVKVEETTTTTDATTTQTEDNNSNVSLIKQSHEGVEYHVEVPLKPQEKKKLDWKNQLYLAPLTTVGNLPFRRICKSLGVDITCGEMALASNIVQGHKGELALLKRHPSEDKFGVQLCGPHLDSMMSSAEFIEDNLNVDFVDVNSGCPIDLICNMGAGAAMMDRQNRMEMILRGMSSVLTCPLTIKLRVGRTEENPNAHKIIPNLGSWGAQAVTVHGRSRTQRYTRLANWEYIKQCAEISPIPVIGNGDIYNWRDIEKSSDSISALMVARGALIKPWIFTEIKEKRDWDISASERLDLVKQFANYGLDHWGSDQLGVDNTRHFLLNWLSFSHRYVPVGILETSYSKINERPPGYFGRSDLETLLASNQVSDWIKISEMFLGPVPSNYDFIPKHNSNSYDAQG